MYLIKRLIESFDSIHSLRELTISPFQGMFFLRLCKWARLECTGSELLSRETRAIFPRATGFFGKPDVKWRISSCKADGGLRWRPRLSIYENPASTASHACFASCKQSWLDGACLFSLGSRKRSPPISQRPHLLLIGEGRGGSMWREAGNRKRQE